MRINMSDKKKPIVYSCSGCSNLAQIAHDLALNMDKDGIAEMSCISGVIGKVGPILEVANSGLPIFAIDGCSLACTKACLDACGISVEHHFDISQYGFEKRAGQVSWRKAAINFAGQSWFLGDFIINTQTNKTKKEIVGLFEKTNNKLGLEGKIILSENGMLEFVGSIATNIDQDLYSAIALFNDGKPANGRLPIRYKQSMF